jgi:hypothetical protein
VISYGKYKANGSWKLCRLQSTCTINGYEHISYLNNTICNPARFTPYGIIHKSLVRRMEWDEFTEEERMWIIEGCLNE